MCIGKRIFVAAILTVAAGPLYGADNALTSKQGGICFRGDDNHAPEKWEQLASVFERRGFKLCAALNLARAAQEPDYLRFVRDLQNRGHEVMDHSPSHSVCSLVLGAADEAAAYRGRPGVDHVAGNMVCFRYRLPDPPRYRGQGRAAVNGDALRPNRPDALADWPRIRYVIVDGSSDVYLISKINNGAAQLQTIWREEAVDLQGPREAVYKLLDQSDVHVAPEALIHQTEKVREICQTHGIAAPKTWIQPGGLEPTLWREHAAAVFGKRFGYVAAATYPDRAMKCFGEYDPLGDKRFGMQWGNFKEDDQDLAWNKRRIADGVARHYVMIGHSHLNGPKELGGWQGVLERTDMLLEWCRKTGIPVRTYREWARILYDVRQDPTINVFPRLDVDRDDDGRPDGIQLGGGVELLPRGGPDGGAAVLVTSRNGAICSVSRLAGLEKGPNVFSCSIQGEVGSTIEAEFRFPESRTSGRAAFQLKETEWRQFTHSVIVPKNASAADVVLRLARSKGGAVRISKLSLAGQP